MQVYFSSFFNSSQEKDIANDRSLLGSIPKEIRDFILDNLCMQEQLFLGNCSKKLNREVKSRIPVNPNYLLKHVISVSNRVINGCISPNCFNSMMVKDGYVHCFNFFLKANGQSSSDDQEMMRESDVLWNLPISDKCKVFLDSGKWMDIITKAGILNVSAHFKELTDENGCFKEGISDVLSLIKRGKLFKVSFDGLDEKITEEVNRILKENSEIINNQIMHPRSLDGVATHPKFDF